MFILFITFHGAKNMIKKFGCHLPENAVDMSVSAGGVVRKVGHFLQYRVLS